MPKDWGFAIRIDGGVSHHDGVIDYGWQDRFIISQDTGLKDKNGEDIYIGDICFYAPYDRYVPVLYEGGMVVIKIQEFEEYYISQHLDELEVVGNIWQNSDWLE